MAPGHGFSLFLLSILLILSKICHSRSKSLGVLPDWKLRSKFASSPCLGPSPPHYLFSLDAHVAESVYDIWSKCNPAIWRVNLQVALYSSCRRYFEFDHYAFIFVVVLPTQ